MTKMTFSKRERKILGVVQMAADTSVPQISKKTRIRSHTVRYVLNRLEEDEVIKKYCIYNLAALGLSEFSIYFSLCYSNASAKEALYRFLQRSSYVGWAFELGGEYQYGVYSYCKRLIEVEGFLDSLCSIPGIELTAKSIALRSHVSFFRRGYFTNSRGSRKELSFRAEAQELSIDELDHGLLKTLSKHPERSVREHARELGVGHSTLLQRIKRLENAGVLTGLVYSVRAAKLGFQTFRILVETRGSGEEIRKAFCQFAREHPAIHNFVVLIGSWDFEFIVEVEEMSEVVEITQSLHAQFGSTILSTKVCALLKYLKRSHYPFSAFSHLQKRLT